MIDDEESPDVKPIPLAPITYVQIHRFTLLNQDFSSLSKEERVMDVMAIQGFNSIEDHILNGDNSQPTHLRGGGAQSQPSTSGHPSSPAPAL